MSAFAIWVSFYTIVSKEIRRFSRIWAQTLLPPVITTTLYFVIFGNLIGPRIGEMGGYEYMQYILPGLVMMAVINNTYANVVSSFYGNKFQRCIEELLLSPTPNIIILLGYVCGGMVRGLLVGFLVTLVALFFTELTVSNVAVVFAVVLLSAFLFSCAGFINALMAKSFDDITIIPTFVLTPLVYFGGVFYSIDLLPEIWQSISFINPMLYIVNAFRYGILGSSDISLEPALILIAAFAVLLFTICWIMLNRGYGIRK